MNKKEFIKTLTDMSGHTLEKHDWDAGWDAAISEVLEVANELDEPEKVVIPLFMAEHIIRQKELTATLLQAIGRIKLSGTEMVNWITNDGNDVLFCKAWLYGYEVEKEKKYIIKFAPSVFGTSTYGSIGTQNGKKIMQSVYGSQEGIIVPNQYTRREIEEVGSKYMIFAEEVTE